MTKRRHPLFRELLLAAESEAGSFFATAAAASVSAAAEDQIDPKDALDIAAAALIAAAAE